MVVVAPVLVCPRCSKGLARTRAARGLVWVCASCPGRAVTMPVLRRLLTNDVLRSLWHSRAGEDPEALAPCPACRRNMEPASAEANGSVHRLDLCRVCQVVWFDASEFDAMPRAQQAGEPSKQARQALARAEAVPILARTEPVAPHPDSWEGVVAMLGLPLELRPRDLRRTAWVTSAVAVLVAAISVWGFLDRRVVDALAFVPSDAFRTGGATMLTVFFVHAGPFHLLSNLYFLVVFGDDVEDLIGRLGWVLLVASATLGGCLLHFAGDPRGDVPTVGASGGIAGLLTFYALKWPHVRLGTRMRAWFGLRWITFSARNGFLFWLATQAIVCAQQVAGAGQVSALAHIGGAAVGAAAWYWYGRSV